MVCDTCVRFPGNVAALAYTSFHFEDIDVEIKPCFAEHTGELHHFHKETTLVVQNIKKLEPESFRVKKHLLILVKWTMQRSGQ